MSLGVGNDAGTATSNLLLLGFLSHVIFLVAVAGLIIGRRTLICVGKEAGTDTGLLIGFLFITTYFAFYLIFSPCSVSLETMREPRNT